MLLFAAITITIMAQTSIYDFNAIDNKGNEVQLAQFKGKVLLIVNTATACGFTPQYNDLDSSHRKASISHANSQHKSLPY